MSRRRIADPDVRALASLAGAMEADYADADLAWEGSPFAWTKKKPSRQRGKIGEMLVAGCLGVSPFDAHGWVLPKRVLLKHVIGHTGQHGGRQAGDTAWLHVDPSKAPAWLAEWGGRLSTAFRALKRVTRRA